MTQLSKTYPGMTSSATEFFTHGSELKVIQNGCIKNFNEISFCTIQILKEAIVSSKETSNALFEMHPNSEIRRIEQFAMCRFGGLDFDADIKEGVLQDGEFWPCPSHGNCAHEGILCKLPMFNGHRLSKTEVLLMQKSSTEKTNEVIAEELELPFGSFHKAKKNLYEKLAVQTKQEVVKIAIILNLIQL